MAVVWALYVYIATVPYIGSKRFGLDPKCNGQARRCQGISPFKSFLNVMGSSSFSLQRGDALDFDERIPWKSADGDSGTRGRPSESGLEDLVHGVVSSILVR